LTVTPRAGFFKTAGFNIVQTFQDDWSLMTLHLRKVGF
jgi:hypothetical protein